jgi:hypothetical protein
MHIEFLFAVLICCLAVNVVFHTEAVLGCTERKKQNAMHK